MARGPSIKGSIVANHAVVLQKYLAEEKVDDTVLKRHFEPGDLDTLFGEIDPTRWYDIEMYARLLDFLRAYPGRGRDQYLIDAGRRSAEKLIAAGIHQQFEYLKRTQHMERTDVAERSAAFGRDLRLLSSITGSILNFAHTEVVPDHQYPHRWIMQHTDARAYPEPLCWTSQGFSNRMAEEHGAPDIWYWERPQADVVHFRMNREI